MQEICSHCASVITHTRLQDPSGIYCCHSCQTVAELLRSEDLEGNYRHLMELSKTSPRKLQGTIEHTLSQLLQGDAWKEIGTWKEQVHQVEFSSAQIHCAACGWLLERALALPGIHYVRVDFASGQMEIHYSPEHISLETILRRAQHYGYLLSPLEHGEADPSESMEKALLYRLAVAGFAMMNVATFTFSAYEEHFSSLQEWTPLMNLWALLLTLPVLFYSATPFYTRAWAGLRAGVLHMDLPVSLGILFSFVASVLLWLGDKPAYFDTASGVVFFLLLGRWWVQRFERGLIRRGEWAAQLLPEKILRILPQGEEIIPPALVQKGDQIRLGSGEMLPFKSTLLGDSPQDFDPQWMTGESRLTRIQPGHSVPSGYLCTSPAVVEVMELYHESDFYQLRKQWRSTTRSTRTHKAEALVPYFTAAILILALLAAWLGRHQGWIYAFEQAALVLILSCPCALALARPVSEGLSLGLARKGGYLLRGVETLETLERIDAVVLDKTGTLTAHRRNLESWQWIQDAPLLRDLIGLCASTSLHPSSRALASELLPQGNLQLITSEAVEHLGAYAQIQAGPHIHHVWICRAWLEPQDFDSLNLDPSGYDPNYGHWDSMALVDGQVVALMRFSEEILPGARQMVQDLQKAGRQVWILSGDRPERVADLAQKVGASHALGALSPFDKAAQIQELKSKGFKVLTAGDGFNDALMLGKSDLAALAYGGARSLGGQAEILALQGNWQGFARLFSLGASRRRAEWAGYSVSLIYNALALGLALSGSLAPLIGAVAMPLSSMSVGLITWLFLRK